MQTERKYSTSTDYKILKREKVQEREGEREREKNKYRHQAYPKSLSGTETIIWSRTTGKQLRASVATGVIFFLSLCNKDAANSRSHQQHTHNIHTEASVIASFIHYCTYAYIIMQSSVYVCMYVCMCACLSHRLTTMLPTSVLVLESAVEMVFTREFLRYHVLRLSSDVLTLHRE